MVCGISIHSLRMEGDCFEDISGLNDLKISIHSLRMEGDLLALPVFTSAIISIHSLRMEGDCRFSICFHITTKFQSTPSAWRETHTSLD